ncbi:unnamed protein product [marine sediment metagenome]|uniref:Uncharacterized protein n=1 Tax=marine sediment metagenome TaxID=412755 RepID=X1LBP8_9ZZZZ
MSSNAAWAVAIVAIGVSAYVLYLHWNKLPLGWPLVKVQAQQAAPHPIPAPPKPGTMPTGFPGEWEVTA